MPDPMPRANSLKKEWKDFWFMAAHCRKAVVDFPPEADSEHDPGDGWDERVVKDVDYLDQANAISSEYGSSFWKGKHMLFLDLDIAHVYVPSTTEGHGHLIVQTMLSQEAMQECLDVLAKHGVVQEGFAKAAAHRKSAWLRVPWFKKWNRMEDFNGGPN